MRNDDQPFSFAVVESVESRLLFAVSPTELGPPAVTVVATNAGYVRGGGFAKRSFGNSSTLEVKSARAPGQMREAYISFDLSGLGVAPIASATLRLFGRRVGAAADGQVTTNLFDA